ncbi:hypothetical protein JYB88_15340 [Shewanella cyperi]|uniref:Uncharacterized protein n=1 Tax=Shewanella cyperi TaxID=2814292 RepID=A0A975AKB1_9GAMM|nr:DUF6136 family protein [Shewanella cyperi]QSX29551.1 hypothetical protein JYB88_15340 [Shewanella cyperi]
MSYLQLRLLLLAEQLKVQLSALRQSGLLTLTLLGSALPAALFALIYAFGILLDPKLAAAERLEIWQAILLLQGLGIWTMAPLLRASEFQLLLVQSRSHHSWHQGLELLLALLSPLWLLPALILLSIPPGRWPELAAQFLLLANLAQLSRLLLHRPHCLPWLLLLPLPLLTLPPSLLMSTSGQVALLALLTVLPRMATAAGKLNAKQPKGRWQTFKLPPALALSASLLLHKGRGWLLRALLCLGLARLAPIASLPGELQPYGQLMLIWLLACIAASWQFVLNRELAALKLWLASLPKPRQAKGLLLAQTTLMLPLCLAALPGWRSALLLLALTLGLQCLAARWPQRFSLGAFACLTLLLLGCFLLSHSA